MIVHGNSRNEKRSLSTGCLERIQHLSRVYVRAIIESQGNRSRHWTATNIRAITDTPNVSSCNTRSWSGRCSGCSSTTCLKEKKNQPDVNGKGGIKKENIHHKPLGSPSHNGPMCYRTIQRGNSKDSPPNHYNSNHHSQHHTVQY